MYKIETDKPCKASFINETKDKSELESDKSGGETEGSEYNLSEDENAKQKKEKKRTTRNHQLKEKAKKGGNKNKKEEDSLTVKKATVIDVDALLKSSSKKSVTTKTMQSMTALEQTEILGSAGKTLLKQAQKGLRVEAMKVACHKLVIVVLFLNF
jgi:hypothetical protein